MDSKLKTTAILLTALGGVAVLSIVLIANSNKLTKNHGSETQTASVQTSVQQTGETSADNGTASSAGVKLKNGADTDAWKNDETFFDSEADTLAEKILMEMTTLSLSAVSVEKDLRIRVLDYNNDLKKDIPFEVNIKNLDDNTEENITDDDCDGVLYLDNVNPGEYEVSLKPVEEYMVPDKGLKIQVKEAVEYTMIEDISLLINSEENISKRADDTMILSASEDADKNPVTSTFSSDNGIFGVDISEENGEVDWNAVYESGIRFVMLRAGYRGASTGKIVADQEFKDNAKNAIRAGLKVGAYFYSQAVNEKEAVEEASAILLMAGDLNLSYPLVIRFDVAGGLGRADSLDTDTRTLIAEAFCQTVKNSGREAGVYASKNWLNTNVNAKRMEKYMVWMAEFRKVPTYEGYYDIWQYSDKGKVPGIEGDVCLNISYIAE